VIEELIRADVLITEGEALLTLPIGHRPRTTEAIRRLVFGPPQAKADELREDEIQQPPIAAIANGRMASTGSALAG